MEVDRNAPVIAHSEAEIAADPATVWEVLTSVDAWPNWNPDVKSASISGDFAPSARFQWKAGPSTIKSTVQEVAAPERAAWTGKTLGIRAIHVHRLEAHDGSTTVHSDESWDGLLPKLLTRLDAEDLAARKRRRASAPESRGRAPRSSHAVRTIGRGDQPTAYCFRVVARSAKRSGPEPTGRPTATRCRGRPLGSDSPPELSSSTGHHAGGGRQRRARVRCGCLAAGVGFEPTRRL